MTDVRLLALQHEAGAPPGLLDPWARQRGCQLDVVRVDLGEALPDPTSFDFAIVLGATPSVFDDRVGWIATELEWIGTADAVGLPLLGICFGAQAIAAALGGEVRAAPRPEIGWIEVQRDDTEIATGPWLAWHRDVIEPPAQARLLAHNAVGVQAFALDRHLAVQFHPEATTEIAACWVAESPQELQASGIDGAALIGTSAQHAARARGQAFSLFDGFIEGR